MAWPAGAPLVAAGRRAMTPTMQAMTRILFVRLAGKPLLSRITARPDQAIDLGRTQA
jgi:hypothetical protein